jgi:hypothetical protein
MASAQDLSLPEVKNRVGVVAAISQVMQRKYLILILHFMALTGKAQTSDTGYQIRIIPKTDIEIVFSYYNQDGNHSAVTGGVGTEALNVYAPGVVVTQYSGLNKFSLEGGADVISSASTDLIDAHISSASRVDIRSYANVQYNRRLKHSGVVLGFGSGFSIESDYLSFPLLFSIDYTEPSGLRQYSASFQAFFDDLRWGRLNPDYRRPVGLIYPAELRYKDWYDVHNRYSYNLKFGFVQVVNKRMQMGIYPEFIYQKGLLATPFHRVYFTDGDLRVENLPKKRFRYPLALRLHYFAGDITIIKAGAGAYQDNFGIKAGYIDLEMALKITRMVSLSPFARYYRQSAAAYFEPYGTHNPFDSFYTSDFDLSQFQTYTTGLTLRYAPLKYMGKRSIFNEVKLRYTFFKRTDHLTSHIFTAAFGFTKESKKPNDNR